MDKKLVIYKICDVYEEEKDKKIRLLDYLAHSSKRDQEFNILTNLLDRQNDFKDYCENIIENIDIEANQRYALNNLELARRIENERNDQGLTTWTDDNNGILTEVGIGVANFWSSIPREDQKQIIIYIIQWVMKFSSKIPNIIPDRWALLPRDFGDLSTALANLNISTDCGLEAIYLPPKVFYSIYQWYRGEITGKQAVRNIMDATVAVGSSIASVSSAPNYYAGRLRSVNRRLFCLPIKPSSTRINVPDTPVFDSTCTILSHTDSESTNIRDTKNRINMLEKEIFALSVSEAVEKAYNYLGISQKASNEEVNNAYKERRARFPTPYIGKFNLEYIKLQCYMTIVKLHRGEIHECIEESIW